MTKKGDSLERGSFQTHWRRVEIGRTPLVEPYYRFYVVLRFMTRPDGWQRGGHELSLRTKRWAYSLTWLTSTNRSSES